MPLRYIHVSVDLQIVPVKDARTGEVGYQAVMPTDNDGRPIPGVTLNTGKNAAKRKLRAGMTARQVKRRDKKRTRIRWRELERECIGPGHAII
jgi:hypothetical protein